MEMSVLQVPECFSPTIEGKTMESCAGNRQEPSAQRPAFLLCNQHNVALEGAHIL